MEGSTIVSSSDWASVITAITTQVNVESIVGVLAVSVGACIGIVFMWWGVGKASSALMSAFRKRWLSM